MSSEIAIRVNNLSKCYQIYNAPRDRLKQFVLPRMQKFVRQEPKQYFREFWALKDVSFEIKKGETVGIIGLNGAGKSTLLQIISGTLTPTTGGVEVNGRVAALLELGAGFNVEFTGRENVFMYGAVLGLTHEEIEGRFDAIEAFADIGEFLEQPVKTYSSGMFARLAFSVAINVEPTILIIDEALSVGDIRFQQKCYRKLRELQSLNITILFVSHDVVAIKNICKTALLIDRGILLKKGEVDLVTNKYFEILNFYTNPSDVAASIGSTDEFDGRDLVDVSTLPSIGDKRVRLCRAGIFPEDENQTSLVQGEIVILKVTFDVYADLQNIFIGFLFKDNKGIDVFGSNTQINGRAIKLEKGKRYLYELKFRMPHLINKKYSIDLAISDGNMSTHTHCCWIHDALFVNVNTNEERYFSHSFVTMPLGDVLYEEVVEIK